MQAAAKALACLRIYTGSSDDVLFDDAVSTKLLPVSPSRGPVMHIFLA